jgi:hypothetical protein
MKTGQNPIWGAKKGENIEVLHDYFHELEPYNFKSDRSELMIQKWSGLSNRNEQVLRCVSPRQ